MELSPPSRSPTLVFGTVGRARNRLNLLRERGRPRSVPALPAARVAIVAVGDRPVGRGDRGRQSGRGAAPPGRRYATPPPAWPRPPRLDHLLAVNGFFVALTAHARTHDGVALVRWWNEARCRDACGTLVRPDGHGVWRTPGRRVPFWLEMDLGTEPLRGSDRETGRLRPPGRDPARVPGAVLAAHHHSGGEPARATCPAPGLPDGVTVATAPLTTADAGRSRRGGLARCPATPGASRWPIFPVPAGGAP